MTTTTVLNVLVPAVMVAGTWAALAAIRRNEYRQQALAEADDVLAVLRRWFNAYDYSESMRRAGVTLMEAYANARTAIELIAEQGISATRRVDVTLADLFERVMHAPGTQPFRVRRFAVADDATLQLLADICGYNDDPDLYDSYRPEGTLPTPPRLFDVPIAVGDDMLDPGELGVYTTVDQLPDGLVLADRIDLNGQLR